MLTPEQEKRVRNIIADELAVDDADVQNDAANLTTDLGADSLDVVELVMSLEERFGIEISDEELEPVQTVGDVIRLIDAKCNP